MNKKLVLVFAVLVSTIAFATQSPVTPAMLKAFANLGQGESIVNTTDDVVAVKSNDEALIFSVDGYEAKDATLRLCADECDDAADKFSFKATTGNELILMNGTSTLSVMEAGGQTYGALRNQVTFAANGSLTAGQCGSTAISNGAVTITLPEASTVLGCDYTFIVGSASVMNINPADANDQIVLLTNAGGDALVADAVGESIILQAIGANSWAPVNKEQGTWTDSN